jgi:hypothetical protein
MVSPELDGVAWRGTNADTGQVYDACLRLDSDASPDVQPPRTITLPIKMIWTTYRGKLGATPARDDFITFSIK